MRPTLGMYGFHSGTMLPLSLFRALLMYCSGRGPTTLCARLMVFRKGGTILEKAPKLLASACTQHKEQRLPEGLAQQP